MDANCTKWSYATPTTGRMPESGKEVAMDTAALQLLGVTPELGAEVTVSYSITDKDQTAFTVTDTFTLVGYWDYDELIAWEAATNIYNNAINSYTEPYPDDVKEGLRILADTVDKVEIEAQVNPAFVWLPNDFRSSNEPDSKGTTANKKISEDSPIAQLLKGIFSTNH